MLTAMTAEICSKDRAFLNTPSSLPPSKKGSIYITSSGGGLRGCSNEITTRHLSSFPMSSSKSNSSCISSISSSSSSSSSSSTPRRLPSPLHNPLSNQATLPQRRAQSVDRTRPSPEDTGADRGSITVPRAVLKTTCRSLPVSFQGESFYFQTSKAKSTPGKPKTECRRPIVVFAGAENSKPNDQRNRRCLMARPSESNLIAKSLDCSLDSGNPILMTVRLMLDDANSTARERPQSSLDSNSLSSMSILDLPEQKTPPKPRGKPRGICVPARFRQENGYPRSHVETPQKLVTGNQQQLTRTKLQSPKFVPSPLYESSSAAKDGLSRTRRNIMASYSSGHVGDAPSIISFASEVRRTKKGENRIEDAHLLRLFHNRYLQWRYINSRAKNAFLTQLMNTKNNLHNAWIGILELHDSAMNKQIQLQSLMQNLKLASILREQIAYLDEWSTIDNDHAISVRGAIEALKASTLRLPVIEGAKVDILKVKDAMDTAVGVAHAMTSSMCSSRSTVEVISSLASEVSKAASLERSLLNQSKDLLSMVAALHVKQCSLQGYMLQLGRKASLMQLQ